MYELIREDPEIESVLSALAARAPGAATEYPGMTYEDGVAAAVEWLVGRREDPPVSAPET